MRKQHTAREDDEDDDDCKWWKLIINRDLRIVFDVIVLKRKRELNSHPPRRAGAMSSAASAIPMRMNNKHPKQRKRMNRLLILEARKGI